MIRRRFQLITATLICTAIALAGDVRVKVTMTTGPEDEETTTFAPDTPKIYAMFKTKGITSGDKIRGVLVADDVGDAAQPNTKVLEKTITLEEDTDNGDFDFSKPTNGWPTGKYHVEIYVNNELATTAKFTVKAAAKPKKSPDQAEEESGD